MGVGHTRAFPFTETPADPNFAENYRNLIQPRVIPILQEHNIKFEFISLRRRAARNGNDLDSGKLHTLVIDTRSPNTETWRTAAGKIQAIFQQAGVESDQIEVEICDMSRLKYNISRALPDDKSLVDAMSLAKIAVMDTLRSYCAKGWTSVAFHLRRPKSNREAPLSPTILVFFGSGTTLDFDHLQSILLLAIQHSKVPLKLELLQGEIKLYIGTSFGTANLARLSKRPQNGSSIGVAGNTEVSGSLGGWLVLNIPKSPSHKVALTCNYVVARDEDENKKMMVNIGKGPSGASGMYQTLIECPAASDRIAGIRHCKKDQESEDPLLETKAALDILTELDKNPVIGTVLVKSGVRINNANRRLDWALIETPSTYTKNKPPPQSAFAREGQFPDEAPSRYVLNKDSVVQNFGVLEPGMWVTKRGKRTGVTSGVDSSMKRATQIGNIVSEEVEVLGLEIDFVQSGDLGSFVTDASGNLVGLVTAGEAVASEWAIGFVTPIADIQQDVKKLTGGFLSLE